MKQFPNNITYDKNHKTKTSKGLKASSLSLFTTGLALRSSKNRKHNVRSLTYLSHVHYETMRRIIVRCLRPRGHRTKNKKHNKFKVSTKKIRRRRKSKKKNALRLRHHFYSPITKKPLQVRMGKGKGTPHIWVQPLSHSKLLLELSRRRLGLRRIIRYANKASIVLPKKTKLIFDRNLLRREHHYKIVKKY